MALREIQEYIARDVNNIARVEDEGNIVSIEGNIFYYYPYRAFGGQNKIVYSTRFVRRTIFFEYCPDFM